MDTGAGLSIDVVQRIKIGQLINYQDFPGSPVSTSDCAYFATIFLPPRLHARSIVLFHITQVHTPETCPRDDGGSNSLFNANVPGLKLIGRYGANAQHTLFYIVEATDVNAIHKFLWPGFRKCTATVTPVSEVPVPKD